ncbi:restriction endonuclease [Halocatena pleomorpha]|uniref:Restriction endonuclease n=1 Tax=Halocatena pleomorpha TaxID=1785090 RepID=A0A3P3RF07_9EURY|nr:restriction endonuclease [Halocatena pleomorpha]RRJ31519.1 restriction endonuclease [Halocatena pleomorpha]
MTVLDDLSGLEFESIMVDVFRNYGYENVRQTPKTGDEGRDILMTESVNGHRQDIVVECKHMEQVGRGVVQKLHSAVITYENSSPVRGMVVTSGTFTIQAHEYVEKVKTNGNGLEIDLVDGNTLVKIADQTGLDLQNGTVELICHQTLPPGDVEPPVVEQFEAIKNIATADLDRIESTAEFRPLATIETHTDAQFETSVGVIHSVNERDTFHVHGDHTPPQPIEDSLQQFIAGKSHRSINLSDAKEREEFVDTTVVRFRHAETDFEAWAVDRLQEKHATTVEYTGDNNVDYEKECVPTESDVSTTEIEPLYVPRIRSETQLNEYVYTLEYDAVGSDRHLIDNGIARCVHCGWSWTPLTYCDNCGSISCWRHIRTERTEGKPVCTDCAVTERFALRKRYFYNEENRKQFRQAYEQRSLHQQVLENKPLIVAITTVIVLLIVL